MAVLKVPLGLLQARDEALGAVVDMRILRDHAIPDVDLVLDRAVPVRVLPPLGDPANKNE